MLKNIAINLSSTDENTKMIVFIKMALLFVFGMYFSIHTMITLSKKQDTKRTLMGYFFIVVMLLIVKIF